MKKHTKNGLKLFVLFILLCGAFILSLFLGAVKPNWLIIQKLRLPRSVLVLLAGSLLAASGAVFQIFFQNPLAEPGLIGISSGATLGAVISVGLSGFTFFGGFISSINLFAFAGAFLSGLILSLISAFSNRRLNSVVLLLCGTALGTFYSSISSFILLKHNKELYGIFTWLMGSFNGRNINELKFVLIPSVLAFIIMFLITPALDVMNSGEENAQTLGINLKALRILVVTCGAFAVSVAVCAGGTISFVGLVAPHIMRRIFSPKSKLLIISSAMGGALLLLVADTLSRIVVKPGELPCGIITSLIGVPFFLALIFRQIKGNK